MAEAAHPSAHDAAPPATQEALESEIAAALEMLRRGAPEGLEQLIPLVYSELRRMAHRQLASESAGHTLSTTALVHEAYVRLAGQRRAPWVSRAHFLALAGRAMRRVLVDYARRHQAARRGGPHLQALPLDEVEAGADAGALSVAARGEDLLALDEALERLAAVDPRAARVVECRFFGGLSQQETAEALGVSQRTVTSDWLMARGYLLRMLRPEER